MTKIIRPILSSKSPTTFSAKVRISYPHIFKPAAKTGDDGKIVLDDAGQPILEYTCALIIPKSDTATIEMLQACMRRAAVAFFGEAKVPPKWNKGLRDGDTDDYALLDPLDPKKGRKPEYVGHMWINCRNKRKPMVIGDKKDEFTGTWAVLNESDLKAGDWVRAQIECYGFDVGLNKGVAFSFSAIQFVEEGEALVAGGFDASLFEGDEDLAAEFG